MENYKLLKKEYIDEVQSNCSYYVHKKSGARILILENNDDNKVFSIGFRTPPTDSTGVPHILEHSTLCGSEKFPVKDPFVELLKSSLNTFLNAMTYPDKTIYPVASCNDKDFANLMEVYMDAVLYPNVYKYEEIFKQEGWHYELNNPEDDIIYNGVVYNEMKGSFSNSDMYVYGKVTRSLYPDTTYGVVSGGDPEFIPDLTYDQFKNFHSKYYHPSNSYIILYGNMNAVEKLEWLDKEYLSKFDTIDPNSSIDYQTPFSKPKDIKLEYPIGKEDSLENKTYYCYSSCTGTYKDKLLGLALSVLNTALLDMPGAPLKQALLDSGLCQDILSDYSNGILQPNFVIICKNGQTAKLDEFKKVLNDTLKEIVNKGVDKKTLLSVVNNTEFKIREADFGNAPKGLVYGLNAMDSWLYDEDGVFDNLTYNKELNELKENINTNYFEEVIQKYLIENSHAVFAEVAPSKEIADIREAKIKEKLRKYKESLSKEEIDKLIEDTKHLKEYQAAPSSPEDQAKMPKLTREDITNNVEKLYNKEENIKGVTVIKHEVFTNGIDYTKFVFDVTDLPRKDISYLSLLSAMLTKVNTKNRSYQDLNLDIMINTGAINAKVMPVSGFNKFRCLFTVEAKALENKAKDVVELVKEIILESDFSDLARLKEIILEENSRLQVSILSSGHVASLNRGLSYISEDAYYNDHINSIGYYLFIKDIVENFEDRAKQIIDKIKELTYLVFTKQNFIFSYTGTASSYDSYLEDFNKNLYNKEEKMNEEKFIQDKLNEGFKTPSQVQYVARCGNFNKAGKYTGSFRVLQNILSYAYLWGQVRVLGGAYGCMCGFSRNGDSYFVSYRDPNLEKTVATYEGIPAFIENFNPTEEELTGYIIAGVSSLIYPLTPKAKGNRSFNAYIAGLTYEDYKKEFEECVNTSVADIKNLGKFIKSMLDDECICVVGNEEKIQNSKLFKNICKL